MAKGKKAIFEVLRSDEIDYTDFQLLQATKSKFVIQSTGGDQLVFTGKKFDYDGGFIADGTVTGIEVRNDTGQLIQRGFNFSIDAGTAYGDNWNTVYASLAIQILTNGAKVTGSKGDDRQLIFLGGNDVVDGRGGDDFIDGGAGRDRLTGGLGSDTFGFRDGNGRDVITDFDADGGVGQQDFIDATYPGDLAVIQVGKNTIINFGDGDTLTLLGVKASHIDATDFI